MQAWTIKNLVCNRTAELIEWIYPRHIVFNETKAATENYNKKMQDEGQKGNTIQALHLIPGIYCTA